MRSLTGMPVTSFSLKQNDCVPRLKEYFMSNYALNVYSSEDKNGLKKGHSYNIVDLVEVTDEMSEKGSKIVAVKLRDPWTKGGTITYSGPEFSKYGLTAKVEANKTFHMSIMDFRKTFDKVYVAMLANNWNVTTQYFDKSQDDNYNMIFENNQT